MIPNIPNSKNSLNLISGGRLSASDSLLLDELEPSIRDEYNQFTDDLIQENKLDGLSLLLNLSCRNTLASPLLDLFCKISLLEEKLKKMDVIKIIYVDTYQIAEIVNELLLKYEQEVDVEIISDKKNLYLHVIFNFIKSSYLIMIYWLWSRLMHLKMSPNGKILFVDNFILIDSFNHDGFFVDRNYTGHKDYLSKDERDVRWYAPTLVGINYPRQMFKVGKGIKSSKDNFLIQEAWLTISDYLYAIYYSLLIPFRLKEVPKFKGLSFKNFILNENFKDISSPSLMLAICKYRFIRRLSKEKINIRGVVEWNENQIIDRAINLGFKDYYKDVIVQGYQGFILPEYYACVQPTCLEYTLGTLPDIMHVPGKAGNALRKSVCPKLPVKISPAFRFSHVFNIQDLRSKELPIILVALPMMLSESKNIIKSIIDIEESLMKDVKLIIKPHPSITIENFLASVPESKNLEITDKNMHELLEICSVMISSTSSSCVEAVSVGIPVAIYGNRYGVTLNPIPTNVPNEMWEVFYTKSELLLFVSKAIAQKSRHPIVSDLFHPMSKEGVRELFTLS
jgi:hypothetical protein